MGAKEKAYGRSRHGPVQTAVLFIAAAALLFYVFGSSSEVNCPPTEPPQHERLAPRNNSARAQAWDTIYNAVTQADGFLNPQLSESQLLWITSTIKQAGQFGAQVLIFGLGYDSRVWAAVNNQGRTIFLEYYQDWIDKVVRDLPSLEVYPAAYNATIAKADAFFSAPWLMSPPAAVDQLCYDVIIVDAPEGGDPSKPGIGCRFHYSPVLIAAFTSTSAPVFLFCAGRMEASYWSIENAAKCIRRGQKKEVVIFLHDVNRKMEQRIIAELFRPRTEELGLMKGPAGDLAGFVMKQRNLG